MSFVFAFMCGVKVQIDSAWEFIDDSRDIFFDENEYLL